MGGGDRFMSMPECRSARIPLPLRSEDERIGEGLLLWSVCVHKATSVECFVQVT